MRFILVPILLAFLVPNVGNAAVHHWKGNCILGCTGTATAALTLAGGSPFNFNLNYFPSHDVSDFVSFSYTSSSSGASFSPYLYAQESSGKGRTGRTGSTSKKK